MKDMPLRAAAAIAFATAFNDYVRPAATTIFRSRGAPSLSNVATIPTRRYLAKLRRAALNPGRNPR